MLIEELESLCIGRISSGYQTDESNIKTDRIFKLIIMGRAIVIAELFKSYKKVHPDWMQEFFPYYDERKQESPLYSVFDGIQNIVLDTIQNSIQYVGNAECHERFRVVYSSGAFSNLKDNPITDPRRSKHIYALYENLTWTVFNRNQHTRIKKFKINGVWNDPFEVPTWNPEMHNFPIDSKGAAMIVDYVFKNYLADTVKSPANAISNSQEDTKIPVNK